MEEILSLIMVSLFAFFPFLFLLASRKRMRERNKPKTGEDPGQNPGQTQRQKRENFDHPNSIVARIMQTQGIRQITGTLKPVPEISPEPVALAPKPPERKIEWQGQKKSAAKTPKFTMEEPERVTGWHRIEALPKLQQAVVWAEILGKPKGYHHGEG